MLNKIWVEIAYPFPNVNGCTIEVWRWTSNFILDFTMGYRGPSCLKLLASPHYGDVKMGAITSKITGLTIVYSTVYADADQRKYQDHVYVKWKYSETCL